jgi:hypothetical protein
VDIAKNDMIGWDTRVPTWRPLKNMTFHDMIGEAFHPPSFDLLTHPSTVPTVDTVRNSFVADFLLKVKRNTGKTFSAQSLLRDLPETHSHSQLVITFSAATTSAAVQDIGE